MSSFAVRKSMLFSNLYSTTHYPPPTRWDKTSLISVAILVRPGDPTPHWEVWVQWAARRRDPKASFPPLHIDLSPPYNIISI